MNKTNLIIFFLCCIYMNSYSIENQNYSSEETSFYFFDKTFKQTTLNMETGEIFVRNGDFKILHDKYDNQQLVLTVDGNEEKYRFFEFDDWLILYKNNIPFFFGNKVSSRLLESLCFKPITATSFLKEGKKEYSSNKLSRWANLNYVWSEGVDGYGIGEKLFISEADLSKIYILPGYVSAERPDLYKKNSRPKTLRITTDTESFTVELKDKVEFQEIKFNNRNNKKIIIEILDVYKGDLYEDTCISSVLCRTWTSY
ncbi:hypothetical protein DYE49_11925 [Treponema rectale]|uniref:NAD glycohydrolase translocation F5/8 type C domain-containing protein n=1 Tax=Treponema rectale TaxID=744512 RepID=A0A840SHV4_9SPIR|nr:hypothetical protein [Treponema rectale]MBB5218972.1 hypothetical protein [Treponema rectale]QOS41116.1 hypothetical protein DYE49_11925 [Treponema rectale]